MLKSENASSIYVAVKYEFGVYANTPSCWCIREYTKLLLYSRLHWFKYKLIDKWLDRTLYLNFAIFGVRVNQSDFIKIATYVFEVEHSEF